MPEEEWVSILASKLGGKVGTTWQDLCMAGEGYQEVKAALLKVCGYTPKLAGDAFFGYKGEAMRGMSADQVYHRGVQLLRRMVAPLKMPADLEFAILRHWIGSVVPKRARLLLDSRVVTTPVELIGALQDHLVMEGERVEGHVAVFTCNEEGHKSTQCPKIKREKGSSKDGQAKPVRRLWNREERDTVVSGIVNGKEVSVVLDSGASVSVVPENMVGEEMKTGEFVSVMAFQSEVPVRLPLARVVFRINHLEWEEEVALAPVVKGQPGEVLCRFDVRSERGWELAGLVRKQDQVLRVTCGEATSEEAKRESCRVSSHAGVSQ